MTSKQENQTEQIGIRVSPGIKAILDSMAREERRTLAQLCRIAIEEFVERRTEAA